MEIKVATTQSHLVAGSGFGVFADITNTSIAPIYLRECDVQLVLPAEVEESGGVIWTTQAFFPTEPEAPCNTITIKSNETYRVFWNRDLRDAVKKKAEGNGQAGCNSGFLHTIGTWFSPLQFIKFAPGEYQITVEAKYWDENTFKGDAYHTTFQNKAVQFDEPQSVILFGATLGGLIFAVLSMIRASEDGSNKATLTPSKGAKAFTKGIAALLGSVLLSIMITILLARISDTQFLIKVSVSDFWGAIAIGFFANYGGWSLLDKIIPPKGGNKPAPSAPDGKQPQGPDANAGKTVAPPAAVVPEQPKLATAEDNPSSATAD